LRKNCFLNNSFTVGLGFPYAEHVKFTVELKIASRFVTSFFIRGGTKEKMKMFCMIKCLPKTCNSRFCLAFPAKFSAKQV
jgi:hypothetical protein